MKCRIPLYLSKRRDRDILEILSEIDVGDRSWFLRELIRDGIRYRSETKQTYTKPTSPPPINNSYRDALDNRLDNM